MIKSRVVGIAVGVLAVGAVAFVVMLFLIKALWAWTIPDLFPGAVEQGLVAESISWFTSVKVALLVAVLSGIAGGQHVSYKKQ